MKKVLSTKILIQENLAKHYEESPPSIKNVVSKISEGLSEHKEVGRS